MKGLWKIAAVVSAAAVMSACGGSDTPTTVASGSTAVTVDASTGPAAIQAVAAQSLAFSGGVPDFGTAGTATTLQVTAPSSSTPTFSVAAGGNTASGDMTFGSCIFTVKSSTFPAGSKLATGARIVVSPCGITLNTAGIPATGAAASVDVTINLNGAVSAPVKQTVSISATGSITVNGTVVTVTKVGTVTGA